MFGIIAAVKKGAKKTKEAYNMGVVWLSMGLTLLGMLIVWNGITSTFWGLNQVKGNLLVLNPAIVVFIVVLICLIARDYFTLKKIKREKLLLEVEVDRLQHRTHTGNRDFTFQKDVITNKVDLLIHPDGKEMIRLDDYSDRDLAVYWEENRLSHLLTPELSMKTVDLMLAVFQSFDLNETKLLCLNLKKLVKQYQDSKMVIYDGGEDDSIPEGEYHFAPVNTKK